VVSAQQRQRPVAVLGDIVQQRYVRTALLAGASSQAISALTAQLAVAVDPAESLSEFAEYLRAGGRALVFAGAGLQNRLDEVVPGVRVIDTLSRQQTRRVAIIDNGHPALSRVDAWADVAVFQHLSLNVESAEVLARLDNGDPWLLEVSVGLGRILLVSASLQPGWTNFAASAGFLPFVEDALGYLGQDFTPADIAAGSTLRLPFGNAQILTRMGQRMLNLGQSQGGAVITLQQPGHYELRTAGMVSASEAGQSAPGRRYLAVNVPAAESDLSLLPQSALQRWREAVSVDSDIRKTADDVADRSTASFYDLPLAPWLLALALLLLVAETLVANGLVPNRQRMKPEAW
jgi:hypothetical protein